MNSFVDSNYYNGNASNGLAQYFTSLYTNNKNVRVDASGDVSLNRDCYNIEVSVTGVGTSNKSYGTSNSCYYGVYNNYVYTEDDCVGSDCSQAGGKKYIFRPIELTDVFPDREPRWNWTNDATLSLNGRDKYLGYNVNPEKTTEHIEDEGHSILNDAEQELDYEIIEEKEKVSLAKIDLHTGRSHQIRVQMKNIGCPVYGDVKYGGDILAKGHNLALWAYELRFIHPTTKENMTFKVYPPEDTVPWKSFNLDVLK